MLLVEIRAVEHTLLQWVLVVLDHSLHLIYPETTLYLERFRLLVAVKVVVLILQTHPALVVVAAVAKDLTMPVRERLEPQIKVTLVVTALLEITLKAEAEADVAQ